MDQSRTILPVQSSIQVMGRERDRRARIRQPVLLRKFDHLSKLVSTLQHLAIYSIFHSKEKRSTVREASTPRIPVRIRKPARYPLVFLQFSQYSVDRLPLRGD